MFCNRSILFCVAASLVLSAPVYVAGQDTAEVRSTPAKTESSPSDQEGQWLPLFNGRDLEGWTPKFRGCELGENYKNTFRVHDGLLSVNYDRYEDGFGNRFGHLFYKDKFSHYLLRIQYRFIGEQIDGGPGWAYRNSGVMLHSQEPASMAVDQDFPVSIEMQMLGGDGTYVRHNANVCTPGTHIEMSGKLIKAHCRDSSSETYHGDDWVTIVVEVRGDEVIRHKIDDKVVLEYEKPQLDPNDRDAQKIIVDGNLALKDGYLALQAESHPVEFASVEIKVLDR